MLLATVAQNPKSAFFIKISAISILFKMLCWQLLMFPGYCYAISANYNGLLHNSMLD